MIGRSHPPFAASVPERTVNLGRSSIAAGPVAGGGVAAAKVPPTLQVPAIHQGSDRPERKYSSRLEPARFLYARPMAGERAKYEAMRIQSVGEPHAVAVAS